MIDARLARCATPIQLQYLEAVEQYGSASKAAAALGKNKSTVADSLVALRKKAAKLPALPSIAQQEPEPSLSGKKIFVLPDVQAKPGLDFSFLMRAGQYVVDKKPDVIVCLGDFCDYESLSEWDAGKKAFEGRRYVRDVEATHEAMSAFLTPMVDYNEAAKRSGKEEYKPRMVLTLGNHEHRAVRAVEKDAKLDGLLSIADLKYKEFGWEVYPFLEVVIIEGVAFSHYFITGVAGRPAGTAAAQLRKTNQSCVAGHQQGKQIAYATRADGSTLTSIICGSFYEHDETFMGPQGNRQHYRGCVMLHEVKNGSFDEMWLSLEFLNKRYAHLSVPPDFSKEHYPEGMR